MTGQQKDALMNQRAGAVADDAWRKPGVVRLDEVDERSDVGKDIVHVHDLQSRQVVDASAGLRWAFRTNSRSRKDERAEQCSADRAAATMS